MDWTPVEHALIAVVLQVSVSLITGNIWYGALLGIGIFFGREHSQAEYRWINHWGYGVRRNLPWYGGFDPRVWDLGSILDLVAPIAGCTVVILIHHFFIG